MSHINLFFFAFSALKIISVAMAMQIIFALINQKIIGVSNTPPEGFRVCNSISISSIFSIIFELFCIIQTNKCIFEFKILII
jgi:hypothetical protein